MTINYNLFKYNFLAYSSSEKSINKGLIIVPFGEPPHFGERTLDIKGEKVEAHSEGWRHSSSSLF